MEGLTLGLTLGIELTKFIGWEVIINFNVWHHLGSWLAPLTSCDDEEEWKKVREELRKNDTWKKVIHGPEEICDLVGHIKELRKSKAFTCGRSYYLEGFMKSLSNDPRDKTVIFSLNWGS